MADFEPGLDFLESLLPDPPPLERLALRVGPFGVWVEDLPAALAGPFEERYQGFVDRAPSPDLLKLSMRSAGVPRFLEKAVDPQGMCIVRGRFIGGRVFLYGWNFCGQFDPAGGSAALALCEPGWLGLEGPGEIFFRVYWAWRAIEAGGFLIHAASVVRDGRAYVFFGHSGAGKSTVAQLSRDLGFILSDDLTLITAAGGEFRAHSVPFRGRRPGRLVSERKEYPVAGLYRLVQSKRDGVRPLTRAIAVANVVSCLPFVTDRLLPKDPAETIRFVERVLERLPVHQLEFTRSPRFWDAVLASGP